MQTTADRDSDTPPAALVECVANVSEGRDGAILAELAAAVRAINGVALLDVHRDVDHHRSVFSFAAHGAARIADAAIALIQHAAARIDVSTHAGVHPRFGVVDVCPFVPLDGVDAFAAALDAADRMTAACTAAAIPSFRYDAAAAQRGLVRSLPDIRRGAFDRIAPDDGPAQPHPSAGAVAIGVRRPLVAFNIDLEVGDAVPSLDLARKIAAQVREAAGGPAGLRAIGLELPRQARVQVSMNLTRPAECGIGTAWRSVDDVAAAAGVRLGRGELVGLVPRVAVADANAEILAASGITNDRVLEVALATAGLRPDAELALDCDTA